MSRYQYNEAATVPAINAELEKIQEAIEDSLSRSGDTPNTMTAPLDMNGERIMNLPEAVSDSEPMRKGEAQAFVDAAAESAAEALASEQAAASSASAASASAASAAADADVADDLIQQLNSIYLGAFTTGPVADNEGNPLQQGALYYNTVSKNLLVFNGTSWVISASQESAAAAELSAVNAAASAAAALASEQAAEDAEALAEQHKDAAFVSASAASGSATSAANSATVAGTAATNAGLSAVAAQTSNIEAGNSASAASDSADAAALSETNAAGSAAEAGISAASASSSASAAATSASNAAASATAAATSETNAASSASSASASATSASNSAATALLYLNDTEAARDEVLQYSTAVSKGLVFIGLYDASTGGYPTLPVDIVGNPFWIISTGGTVSGVVLNPGDSLIYDVTNEVFIKLDTVDQVVSVAGKTGAVSLDKSDVGLANVDNTSDLNKPISTATQTALDLKVDDSQLATAATADSVAQRTSDGSINAVNVYASGNLGVGTASPSALGKVINVEGGGGGASLALDGGDNFSVIYAGPTADDPTALISNTGFKFATATAKDATGFSEKLRIDSSGNVGIDVSSPAEKLMVRTGSGYAAAFNTSVTASSSTGISIGGFSNAVGGTGGSVGIKAYHNHSSTVLSSMAFEVNGNYEAMRIDSSGNVGIGTSPATKLDVRGLTAATIRVGSTASGGSGDEFGNLEFYWADEDAPGVKAKIYAKNVGNVGPGGTGTADLLFATTPSFGSPTERMRIDSSGNVLVGKTTTSSSTAGLLLGSNGRIDAVRDGGYVAYLNRLTSDGDIALFAKNGTTVGSIGSYAGSLMYTTSGLSVPTGVVYGDDLFVPCGSGGAARDNIIPLGSAGRRWSVLYAGTGSINTSDAREKTPVDGFTADELNAAKQLSKEIGTYKFLSAVAKKGDDARKHIGMTVQRAIEIMEANNLDPFAYGFICYDAWEEKTVDHAAVEAKDAEYDEEGNVISEAVEAKDAYTEVVQEAGDRYSFRPDEMLFFIARGLEARIEALEGEK